MMILNGGNKGDSEAGIVAMPPQYFAIERAKDEKPWGQPYHTARWRSPIETITSE
jgi:hypothetical protein